MILYWILGLGGLAAVIAAMNKDAIAESVDEVVTENIGDTWTRFDSLFAANAWGINPRWLKAFCLNESNLGQEKSVARGLENPSDIPGSTSSDGLSWGIMQVTVKTGKGYDPACSPEKLNNPAYSIDLASHLLRDLKKQFDPSVPENLEWIVKSYNQGAGNSKKEKAGIIDGYAQTYWERWQRNFKRVNDKPGEL